MFLAELAPRTLCISRPVGPTLRPLGQHSTVGNLMGFLFGRGFFIEGLVAGVMYRSLRMLHERALHGTRRAVLGFLARGLSRRTGPPVKLH